MRKRRKHFRRIVVGMRHWQYKVSNSYVVARADDNDEVRKIDASALTGVSNQDIERSLWKKGQWHVGPRHVAAWLKEPEKFLAEMQTQAEAEVERLRALGDTH